MYCCIENYYIESNLEAKKFWLFAPNFAENIFTDCLLYCEDGPIPKDIELIYADDSYTVKYFLSKIAETVKQFHCLWNFEGKQCFTHTHTG